MDVFSPIFQLLFRSLVILLPATIGWLAFRRLVISKSGNAWIYAVSCLFAAVTAAGLLPWALGLAKVSWVFFLLSAFCPAIWIGVVTVCDMSRRTLYGPDPVADTVLTFSSRQKPAPLVLENPELPGAPIPVFRHRSTDTGVDTFTPCALPAKIEPAPEKRSLMSVAREMRGNDTSDARRPRLLPAPDIGRLPFIKDAATP